MTKYRIILWDANFGLGDTEAWRGEVEAPDRYAAAMWARDIWGRVLRRSQQDRYWWQINELCPTCGTVVKQKPEFPHGWYCPHCKAEGPGLP